MKKRVLTIVAASLFFGGVSADTYSNKTFLNPQQVGFLVGRDLIGRAPHKVRQEKPSKNKLNVTLFMEQSNNGGDLGNYFGVGNGSNTISIQANPSDPYALDGAYLFHDYANYTASNFKGNVSICPKRTAYGINVALQRDFSFRNVQNLFVRLNVPVVSVEHKVNYSIANESKATIATGGTSSPFGPTDFFSGNVAVSAAQSAANEQGPLSKGKLQNHTSDGFGDVQLAIGHTFFNNDSALCSWYVEGILPTSNKPTAEFLFEPLRGNAGHIGLALGLDAQVNLWKKNALTVQLRGQGKFTYFFSDSETRIPAVGTLINGVTPSYVYDSPLAQYSLVAPSSVIIAPSSAALVPGTNVLAQSMRVRPGTLLEYNVKNCFMYKKMELGLGYGMALRDGESVSRKTAADSGYAVTYANYHVDNQDAYAFPIRNANLDASAAATPSQFTQKIMADFSYKPEFKKFKSLAFSVGGAYQFASDNSALEQYGVWLGMGLSF